jgi:hypothetical protein
MAAVHAAVLPVLSILHALLSLNGPLPCSLVSHHSGCGGAGGRRPSPCRFAVAKFQPGPQARGWQRNFREEEQRWMKFNSEDKRGLDSFVLFPNLKRKTLRFLFWRFHGYQPREIKSWDAYFIMRGICEFADITGECLCWCIWKIVIILNCTGLYLMRSWFFFLVLVFRIFFCLSILYSFETFD